MTSLIIAAVLLLLSIAVVVVRKTYDAVPIVELRRRARRHDPVASKLYRAVAYGSSLRALLWLVMAVTIAVGSVLLARTAPLWLSLGLFIGLVWVAFTWLPNSRVTGVGLRLTLFVNPVIVWLLNLLHPGLSRSAEAVAKRRSHVRHTGLYEREDLLAMIDRQAQQTDSRFSQEELAIAKRALQFTDHRVADVMTPRKQIKTVNADDTVGPILIDELHQNGADSVLVHDKPKGQIIGSLSVSRLGIKSSGTVRDVMDRGVSYLHEDDTLSEALHAFYVTNQPLFIVVNNHEEYVGVITIQTIIEQLFGHVPGDDFGEYGDPAAVAHRHDKPQPAAKTEPADDADITIELE